MPNHGMTPHTSGTSLSAQARYAAGVREILECFFAKKIKELNTQLLKTVPLLEQALTLIVKVLLQSGSEEAAKYQRK